MIFGAFLDILRRKSSGFVNFVICKFLRVFGGIWGMERATAFSTLRYLNISKILYFWNSRFSKISDFLRYLGSKKSHQKSAGVKMIGFLRAFLLSAWEKGAKDKVKLS